MVFFIILSSINNRPLDCVFVFKVIADYRPSRLRCKVPTAQRVVVVWPRMKSRWIISNEESIIVNSDIDTLHVINSFSIDLATYIHSTILFRNLIMCFTPVSWTATDPSLLSRLGITRGNAKVSAMAG